MKRVLVGFALVLGLGLVGWFAVQQVSPVAPPSASPGQAPSPVDRTAATAAETDAARKLPPGSPATPKTPGAPTIAGSASGTAAAAPPTPTDPREAVTAHLAWLTEASAHACFQKPAYASFRDAHEKEIATLRATLQTGTADALAQAAKRTKAHRRLTGTFLENCADPAFEAKVSTYEARQTDEEDPSEK